MVIASTIAAALSEANSKGGPVLHRVVHLLAHSAGGIRRHVRYLAMHPPEGFETAAVVGPSGLAPYFEGVPYRAWKGPRSLTGAGTDLIHAHGLTAGLRAVWSTIGRRNRPAVVVTVHTSSQQTLRATVPGVRHPAVQRLLWVSARALISRADAVIAVSEQVRSHFGATDTVPPAIDMPAGAPEPREQVRRSLGAPEHAVVALAVGRLHPDKALHVFVEAVREAGAVGWIAGEGPDRRRLEKLAEGSGVRLLGQRDDVPSLLGAADLFALPTAGESYGLAVLEAVSAGLPVVATRTGAIPEIVGEAGLLVDPGNAALFTEAMHRVVADHELRSRLAEAAKARRLPSPEDLTARTGAVYARALARRRR